MLTPSAEKYQHTLYLDNVSIAFDGFKAINELSLYIEKNELRCIIGPNGAGKTTMLDIITGKIQADTGALFFKDTISLLGKSEDQIAQLGIGRKFQTPTIFENLSIFENLDIAAQGPKGVFHKLLKSTPDHIKDKISQTLTTINLNKQTDQLAGLLSHGQKQWLEIGMLLVQGADLLLVDEPAAGMTHQEIEKTTELLLSLKQHHTIVVVEHDMDFIRSLHSRVTVLHQGHVLAEGNMDSVQNNPQVIEVYLGYQK